MSDFNVKVFILWNSDYLSNFLIKSYRLWKPTKDVVPKTTCMLVKCKLIKNSSNFHIFSTRCLTQVISHTFVVLLTQCIMLIPTKPLITDTTVGSSELKALKFTKVQI